LSTILEVKNISKQYRLGYVGTGTLGHDINRWWHKIRGKEDPYLKVGEVNDRTVSASSDYVWAVKDVSFQVKKGEILGIIGANGAGKSTLLKILSRVTGPTTGSIKAHGRIASLLEVGTGFHPELTGRENIFLNGAILGMTKAEIRSKLDEIIEFSECERYIDTPVKRYSSGMYVRLAFAVAAHLEPEILIVDEVLAVGDAKFQKKAIGKMKEVSQGEGRTVLFVSHNMAAVRSLCTRGIVLKNGEVAYEGSVSSCVQAYLSNHKKAANHRVWTKEENVFSDFELQDAYIKGVGKKMDEEVEISEALEFSITLKNKSESRIDATLHFKDDSGTKLFVVSSAILSKIENGNELSTYTCNIPPNFFNNGRFYIDLFIVKDRRASVYQEADCLEFTLINKPIELGQYMGEEPGALRPIFDWNIK